MRKAEKIQAIEDMGIDINNECPDYYDIEVQISHVDCADGKCADCWINSLDGAAE